MADAFSLQLNPLELILRGSVMYWFLFLLFRFVLRRDAGSVGIADILLLVLIADASQNAMGGSYTSVPDGIVLVSTIAGWNWLLDWGGYRSRWLRRLAEPPPLVLVRHGRMMRRNMRREFITVPELMASLREHGVDKLAEVKIARMEPDGQISVIHEGGAGNGEDTPAASRRTPGA